MGEPVPDGVSERDALILDHIPLLHHIVGRMNFESGGLDKDDLYGFGMLGLIAAADTWDEARGLKFSTFAYTKVRGAILDEIRRMDFLPRGRREKVRELDRAVRELEHKSGYAPAPEEIAEAMGWTAMEVDEVLAQAHSAAQSSIDDGPDAQLAALLTDPRCDSPSGSAEWEETRQKLAEVIQQLPDQEQTVITLYYGEELMLKEISDILDVTESRVSQIHSRALYRLNQKLSEVIGTP